MPQLVPWVLFAIFLLVISCATLVFTILRWKQAPTCSSEPQSIYIPRGTVGQTNQKCCLYAAHNANGIIPQTTHAMIEALKKLDYTIYFISNNPDVIVPDPSPFKEVFCRPNRGFDWGAWKDVLFNNKLVEKLSQYDWVLFANDSMTGPLYGLEEFKQMIQRMETSGCDFWGATDSHQKGWHIQSYFFELSRNVIRSNAFPLLFPERIEEKTDVDTIISLCELKWADKLVKAGFFPGVAFPNKEHKKGNPYAHHWKSLFFNERYPFFKRKSIPYVSKWKQLIQQNSSFDVDIIASSWG